MAYLSRASHMNSYTPTTSAATLHTCDAHLPMACQLPTKVCAQSCLEAPMCKQINFPPPHASDTPAAALECHAHIGSHVRHTTGEKKGTMIMEKVPYCSAPLLQQPFDRIPQCHQCICCCPCKINGDNAAVDIIELMGLHTSPAPRWQSDGCRG